jgi:alanine dehydrogenase
MLRVLSAVDVRQALPMAEAIAGMREAFSQLSSSQANVPLRSRIQVPAHNGVTLVMPAYLGQSEDLAVKIVSVFPDNVRRGKPTIYAAVILLDATTGRPLALLEGGSLTAIRTGAGSGLATDLLARPEACVVGVLGSGVQAQTQLEAVCTVRSVTTAYVYSPNRDHAQAFAQRLAGRPPMPAEIIVAADSSEAVRDADIICAATTSETPVFADADLKPGAHINAVGSYTPAMQEIGADTILRAWVVVDSREAALAEAGDLVVPISSGLINTDHIQAELGEIVAGRKPGRTNPDQITYFKSVGVAVQDAVAARISWKNAVTQNIGSMVALWA